MFTRILAANDGSDNARKALRLACEIAAMARAELHLIVVEEVPEIAETIAEVDQVKSREDRQARTIISRSEAAAARVGIALNTHVVTGHVVRNIVDFARDNGFDLIVIGATGRSAFYERMLGGRADRIAHLAHCPVLIAR